MSARHRLLLPTTAVLFGLTACTSTPAAAPLSPAPPSTAPTSAASTPTAAAPDPAPTTSRAVPTQAPNRTARGIKCPSAKTLEKLAHLPKGWHYLPSGVECWKTWATADPKGPTVGDGFDLFHYQPGTGWRYHSQGSGYHCKDLGIHESAPFCQYP